MVMGRRIQQEGRTVAGLSSASVLDEGLLSDAPDPFLLHSGAPSIYCARMTEANLGVGGGGGGFGAARYRAVRALAVLLFFHLFIVCVYEPM